MFKVPTMPKYEYQPIGGSSLSVHPTNVTIDPRIAKTRDLFQMFGLNR